MKIKFFIAALFSILTLFGCNYTASNPSPEPSPADTSSRTEEVVEKENQADNDPHPISLPALMEKEFDGRDLKLESALEENDAYTRYSIRYLSGSLTISGIMNIPKGDGPFPLLVLNHGYIDPEIYTIGRGLKREQDYLARQGFAVIHSDYRNHAFSDDDPEYQNNLRIGYIEDVINAILAVQKANLPNVDAQKVGMLGHSMGGGIAQAIAVVQPDLVDAFVLYAPVSGHQAENFYRYSFDNEHQTYRSNTILERYGSPEDNPEFWANISPKTFYDKIESPVMIHIGTLDDSTPPEWSYTISEEMKEVGKDVTLHVYEGEKHEFGPQWKLMMERTAEFFRKLK